MRAFGLAELLLALLRLLCGLLHVVVDPVDDAALVDDEHRQLLEDGLQVADGFRDLPCAPQS